MLYVFLYTEKKYGRLHSRFLTLSFSEGIGLGVRLRMEGVKRDRFSFYIFGFCFFVTVSMHWIITLKIANKTLMFKMKLTEEHIHYNCFFCDLSHKNKKSVLYV